VFLKIICMVAWCYEIVINFNSKYMNFVVVYVYFISMKIVIYYLIM